MALGIAYTRGVGGVSVVTPAILPGETEEQAAARALATDVPLDASDATVIDKTTMPQGRRWRSAWKIDGKDVVVDIDAAKKQRAAELESEIHGFEFRGMRFPGLLDKLSADHQKAALLGDSVAAQAIQAKAQVLATLDKVSLEADIAKVVDLGTLDKHEPDAIKDAKPVKDVAEDVIAVEPR